MVKRFYVDQYAERILAGDRVVLSRAITLAESTLPTDQELAQKLISTLLPFAGNAVRIGVSGAPGVGKSTFIEAFGNYLILEEGNKIAVLTVDPTSQLTGGSILGDKTRMENLSTSPAAYVRPSPAGKSLGGVTRNTRDAITLCEAAGFNIIIVETVGVGQSETAVYNLVDFFLLLLLAGAGDELQGIKKGVMEMADGFAITKADGENLVNAKLAAVEYKNALNLFPNPASGFTPPVVLCSALNFSGIDSIWGEIKDYLRLTKSNGYFKQKRAEQNLYGMHNIISQALEDKFYAQASVKEKIKILKEKVLNGKISPYQAAEELLNSCNFN